MLKNILKVLVAGLVVVSMLVLIRPARVVDPVKDLGLDCSIQLENSDTWALKVCNVEPDWTLVFINWGTGIVHNGNKLCGPNCEYLWVYKEGRNDPVLDLRWSNTGIGRIPFVK